MINATLIYNAQLLDENIDGPGAVLCIEGKIRSVFEGYFTNLDTLKIFVSAIFKEDGYSENSKVDFFDAKGLTLTPSFIDMHVHLRDPGLTQKEDLNSGLHAAIAGGYGTVVAMPNTNPVISSVEQAVEVQERAKKLNLANLIQSVSITENFEGKSVNHLNNLNPQITPLITEDGHEVASSSVMLDGMNIAAQKNIIVSCHCEDPTLAEKAREFRKKALEIMKKYNISAWGGEIDDNIPDEVIDEVENNLFMANNYLELAENIATERNIQLAKSSGCHIHLCHVSTQGAISSIRRAKEEINNIKDDIYFNMANEAYECRIDKKKFNHLPNFSELCTVTCEVTPHHIALRGDEEPGIRSLVNPPLRTEEDRISLIDAIRDGTVDVISTDHAPHTLEDKSNGAPGFTGIETSYAICNTVLVKENQIDSKKLSKLMSANPARILKLNKGLLKSGYDADLTIVNPDESWQVNTKFFCSKGKATPFENEIFTGKVKAVFINGINIYNQ